MADPSRRRPPSTARNRAARWLRLARLGLLCTLATLALGACDDADESEPAGSSDGTLTRDTGNTVPDLSSPDTESETVEPDGATFAGDLDAVTDEGDVGAPEIGCVESIVATLDGSPPLTWSRAAPAATEFPFDVRADALEITADSGQNQHLVLTGVQLDTSRPWRVSVEFELVPPLEGLNSFALLVAVGAVDPVDAWAINVDARADGSGAVMKSMGFVAGGFASVGERAFEWGDAGVAYRLQVDVGRDGAGMEAPGTLSVTVETVEGEVLARFDEAGYTAFPWQPGATAGLGLNSHGADWIARNLVACHTGPVP